MSQPTVEQVWADPDFQGLPAEEKRKVLLELDPDFAGLPETEQAKVVGLDAGESTSQPSGIYDRFIKPAIEIEKQPGLPKSPLDLVKQFGRQVKDGLTSPMPGSMIGLPVRALQENASQIGADVARGLSTPGGILPDAGLPVARAGGFMSSVVSDPTTFFAGGAVAQKTGAAAKFGLEKATEQILDGIETFSSVKPQAVKALYKSPLEVLTAATQKESGSTYGALKKSFGVTREEEKLIAKAGDRTPGVARTVAESLDAKVKSGEATLGELIAARRAALKVQQTAKGSEQFLYGEDAHIYSQQLADRAKPILDAIKEVARSKTRGEFLHLLPRNKGGKGDYFKSVGTLLSMGATSPLSVGLGTLAASATVRPAMAVAKPVASFVNKTVVGPVAAGSTLNAIRSYLHGQQAQPGR